MSKKINDLKARVLGDKSVVANFSKPLTIIEEATVANENELAIVAKQNVDEGIDNNMIEPESTSNSHLVPVGPVVEVSDETAVEEVSSLDDLVTGAEDAVVTDELQKASTTEFDAFMAKLKEAEDVTPAVVAPPTVRHNLIVLPDNLEEQTPEELTRLMKNVQSKKCRSKAMGRTIEYEDSLVAEARIKAAREAQGNESSTGRGAELPADLTTLSLEDIIRHLKNVQSKKCMAKAMGRTEVVDNMLALEARLKAARDLASPNASSYHMQSKGIIIAKIEELKAFNDELAGTNFEGDHDDAIKYNDVFIEALEWAMSATIPGADQTAR